MAKKTLKEIKELVKEPEYDYIEKIVKISYDGRNFVIRIPKKISDYLKISKENKCKFHLRLDKPRKVEELKCQII